MVTARSYLADIIQLKLISGRSENKIEMKFVVTIRDAMTTIRLFLICDTVDSVFDVCCVDAIHELPDVNSRAQPLNVLSMKLE